jgi:hypothetical protein
MSRGAHRKPRPANRRLRRIVAGIGLAAATATGYALTDDTVAAPQGDTTWGAPDTPTAPAATEDDATSDGSGTASTLRDTTWG